MACPSCMGDNTIGALSGLCTRCLQREEGKIWNDPDYESKWTLGKTSQGRSECRGIYLFGIRIGEIK